MHTFKQLQYHALLKSADVNFKDLMSESQLRAVLAQFEFKQIRVEDLSAVLAGFADYVNQHLRHRVQTRRDADWLKLP